MVTAETRSCMLFLRSQILASVRSASANTTYKYLPTFAVVSLAGAALRSLPTGLLNWPRYKISPTPSTGPPRLTVGYLRVSAGLRDFRTHLVRCGRPVPWRLGFHLDFSDNCPEKCAVCAGGAHLYIFSGEVTGEDVQEGGDGKSRRSGYDVGSTFI